jgi:hypothetical protein
MTTTTIAGLGLGILTSALIPWPSQVSTPDALDRSMGPLHLEQQTVIEALAGSSLQDDFALSVEVPLKENYRDKDLEIPRLTADVAGGTVREILDRLVRLDGRFAWSRYKHTINVFPSNSVAAGEAYIFQRRLRGSLQEASGPGQAVVAITRALPPPPGNLVFVQVGGSADFASSRLSLDLEGLTVRQALDEVAQHIGQGYGWSIVGAKSAPSILFHGRMVPHRRDEHK